MGIHHYLLQSILQVNTQKIQISFFLHRNLKIICNSTDKPKLIKIDSSLAFIGGILLQFYQANLQKYLDLCFKVISGEEEILRTFCVSVVCSAHLMKRVKYFVESSMWYHQNKQHKQLILNVLGHLTVYHDFNIIKNCQCNVLRVFYPAN